MDWNKTWDYMQPMGTFPEKPAGGADDDFATTWYLKAADFALQYDGPVIGPPNVAGTVGTPSSYDHGNGAGPLGYETMDYWAVAGAQFTANATPLTVPNSGSRYSSYFRTTFTVPDDGQLYAPPVITYLMDDGGFVYIDGVLVLAVNMAPGATDTYTQFAANATLNENQLRVADLGLPIGTIVGGGLANAAGNAVIVQPVHSLAPGEHTIAVSLHQVSATGSDASMAFKLTAGPSTPGITGIKLNSTRRNLNGTPDNAADDTVDFSITVSGVGSPDGWKVTGPAGSSLLGQTGAYRLARTFTGVPYAAFASGTLTLSVQDALTPGITGTIAVPALLPVIDWARSWDYMQPMGVFPDSPGGGQDADFNTTFYLKAEDFVTQYNGPTFGGATVAGDPNNTATYSHGTGPGPLGFDAMDYWGTAGALFTANGTVLPAPLANNRYTSYYRTTFTVPNDGRIYGRPVINYILDDGGFVYLDGVRVLNVNMAAGATETYTQLAANSTDNENQIRVADLTAAAGGVTGAGQNGAAGNASVVLPITSLLPGEHTLAVSLHQVNNTGTDAGLSLQLTLDAVVPQISEVKLNSVRRNLNGTPGDPADDTVDFSITVNGVGGPAGWVVTGPAGSLVGQTGLYNTPRTFTAVPIAEFPGSTMTLTVRDADQAALTGSVVIVVPFPLVEWNHVWNYMQPMGVFPDKPAGGPDDDFATTWYLKAADFALQYDGPVIGPPQVLGDPAITNSYDHGAGPGPFGFENMDYWTTPGALFTANGTVLTIPSANLRYSSYYRTTFTVPDDGNLYTLPRLTYLMDDGGFVYLDGEPILTVNMAAAATDTYMQLAANSIDNENQLRVADLNLAIGTATGQGQAGAVANATIVKPVTTLAPGEHTLAVSLHQVNTTGSDLGLSLQLTAVATSSAGAGDNDGDGVSNQDEAIMGTDPNNPSSVLRLSMDNPAQPGVISFPTVTGKFYRVYTATDLQTWTDTGMATIPGDNTVKTFTITPTPGQRRYFRLAVMGTDGPWE